MKNNIIPTKTNEADSTDRLVHFLLTESGIENYFVQSAGYQMLIDALKKSSKSGEGHGIPDFNFQHKGFLILIENKMDLNRLEEVETDPQGNANLLMDKNSINNYAVNGAVYYAENVLKSEPLIDKVFAIGVVGSNRRFKIQPYFVDSSGYKKLDDLYSFDVFKEESIEEYYKMSVLGEPSYAQKKLKKITDVSTKLHEDLRTFGKLGSDNKATVVSSILLALKAGLKSSELIGIDDEKRSLDWDGQRIYRAVENYVTSLNLKPLQKIGALLDQFTMIKNNKTLNTRRPDLNNLTPLRLFAEKLEHEVLDHIVSGSEFDVLGNFYSEFVKYGGSDGSDLGIVLTPHNITSLMADLIDINPTDNVLDPATGTGAFLIASMNRMINMIMADKSLNEKEKNEKIFDIKQNRLFGIEVDSKLFAIATTNMILRGDGKSNLHRDDMFHIKKRSLTSNKITKLLMNPPYSQAKKSTSKNESEMHFILRALDFMEDGGQAVFIVPQSTMTNGPRGVRKADYLELKKELLESNKIDAVITMNGQTFYPKATDTVICVITKGIPQKDNRTLFYNFKDDGYKLNHHLGMLPDGSEIDKKKRLLDVYFDKIDVDTSLAVKHKISAEDEWLHSFFYFNDRIPEREDFLKSISEYLTYEFKMKVDGRSYLFEEENK